MAANKRDQLEKLVHDVQALADAADIKGDFSAEEREQTVKMLADAKRLAQEIKDEAAITGGLDEAKDFLAALAAPPGAEKKNGEKHDLTVSGLPMNPRGKTLGEMFVDSPAYGDFVARYGGADGIIKPSTSNSTAPTKMALSATLNAGQCQPSAWKSRKSITAPNRTRSMTLPMAPPMIRPSPAVVSG